ncbi:MAG: fatty acid desaturase [Betaproteobacteria bacterium]
MLFFLNWLSHGILNWSNLEILVFTLVVTHITIASVTIFLHRHQAHRSLDLHPIVSHFFRLWLWLTTGMITKEWAAIHRKHHAKCETENDPHSPQILGINTVLWRGADLYAIEALNQETLDKYGHGTPDDWVENKVYSKYRWQGVGIMLVIDVLLFGAIGGLVWAIQMMWIPVTAAGIINGIGHFVGYRNFDSQDASTNIFPLGILIGGEELHNNHHTYATSAKLSNQWYEFDIGWLYIRALQIMKLATVKKMPPKLKLQTLKRVDLDTLHSIISNRYELMAKYSQTIKDTFKQEVAHIHDLAKEFSDKHQWLFTDEAKLSLVQKNRLENLMKVSEKLKTLVEMRRELAQIWQKSSASSEHLVQNLQEWCHKAELSGLESLRTFSLRLRTYA